MNGENDKLIRDFMNAFEKKGVKVAMKDVNLPIRFLWWTPFFGQKKVPSLDRAAALKMKESQCLKFARVTHPV